MLSYPVLTAPASSGDTVQGLHDVLLNAMKNARMLDQSGRFTQLEPVIRRSFDIDSMAQLSVGADAPDDDGGPRRALLERAASIGLAQNLGADFRACVLTSMP